MTKYNFEAIKNLVAANNQSVQVSDQLVICLIWKESGFDDAVKNSTSTAIGLMQVTVDAVQDVNKNSPKGVHFDYSQMTDAANNIQCGTRYLDQRIKRAGGDVSKGIDRFGTGSGYAKNIIACESCMKQVADAKGAPNASATTSTSGAPTLAAGTGATATIAAAATGSGSPAEQACLFAIHK